MPEYLSFYDSQNRFRPKNSYQPKEVKYIHKEIKWICSHVGIVTGYNPETKEYTTIEGNTSNDTVQQLTRPINDAGLTGFGINTPSKSALKE
ncbi:MAG: hypothetical protein ACLSFA_13330 [Roseburia inulinivorans]